MSNQPLEEHLVLSIAPGVSIFDGSAFCVVELNGKSIGQLTPAEAMDMALQFMSAAHAAESDAALNHYLQHNTAMSAQDRAVVVHSVREARDNPQR